MGRKSFKDKEREFLAKNKINLEEKQNTFVQKQTESEKAYEYLKNKGFNVSIKDRVLYCICKDKEEYQLYVDTLLKEFGREENAYGNDITEGIKVIKKVPFSYGTTIKTYDDYER